MSAPHDEASRSRKDEGTTQTNEALKRAARDKRDDYGLAKAGHTSGTSEANKRISRPQDEEPDPVTEHADKPGGLRGSPD